jgi:uncharacterized protein DUF4412
MQGMTFRPRNFRIWAAVACCIAPAARFAYGDLVILQKVEGASQSGEMTMRIKDDKARADLSSHVSTITNAATGEVVTLMHDRREFMRISGAAAKQLVERAKKMQQENEPAERPKLQPAGKKEKVNGREAERFTWETGDIKMTYWIAKDFPNYAAILAQVKKVQAGVTALAAGATPDPTEFPGMPVKTEMSVNGKRKVTTTLVSIKEEPVDSALFEIPAGYKELPSPAFAPAAQ